MNKLMMIGSAIAIAASAALSTYGATMCSGSSASVKLDLVTGTRTAAATETIRYSTAWVSGAASGATAVVSVNGETLKSATGSGSVTWTPPGDGNYTLTHKVMSGGVQIGETLTATFLVGNPDAPVFSPASGTTFDTPTLSVSISCSTVDAIIHYTIDGSEPTSESSVYKRFKISGKTTVKAVAVFDGKLSDVVTAEYARGQCAEVAVDAATSFTGSKTKVVLLCTTADATIRYTLDGSEPNSHSRKYTGPFCVTDSCVVKAYASKAEWFSSGVAQKEIVRVWGIGDTMGKPDHRFTTDGSGGKGWTRVDDATAPNGEAMRSGAITHNQSSVLSTKVMGPGTLSFSWRTSCEQDDEYEWDHAELSVDGRVRLRLNGVTEWTAASVEITGDGEHTVEWTYKKDDVESAGEDAAWVANYNWASAWTATRTSPTPVPYAWLLANDPGVVDEYESYEASADSTAANGRKVWECYVLGVDPSDAMDDFRITAFHMDGALPILEYSHTTDGDGNSFLHRIRPYGRATLNDEWQPVPSAGDSMFRFFKAVVDLP